MDIRFLKGEYRVDRRVVRETEFEVFWYVLRSGEDTEVGRVLTMKLVREERE